MNQLFKSFRARLVALLTAVFHAPAGFAGSDHLCLANVAEKTHYESVTKLADAALSYRYLLVKYGTDADHIAVAAAADKPLGVCSDQPEAAEDKAEVQLLGATKNTRLMVASGIIAKDADVFSDAAGKVQAEPTVAGTYWLVGRARTAAAADLDQIEVETCIPIKLVVIAALQSVNGAIAAATGSTAILATEVEKLGDDVRAIATALATASLVKVLAA